MIEQKIPAELHMQILTKLSREDLMKSVSLVCKKWCRLIQDFRLVESKVNLSSPFYYSIGKILQDFEKYPTFGHKIKVIKMKDYGEDEDDNIKVENDVEKFNALFKYCSSIEELRIQLSNLTQLSKLLAGILPLERQFKSSLKIFELDFVILNNKTNKKTEDWATVELDLNKLLNYTIPGLEKLLIHSSINICEESRFVFTSCGLNLTNNIRFIRTIKIVSQFSLMTKACLEYITSGCFTNLENLDLMLVLVVSVEDVFKTYPTIRMNDIVLDKLKNYCSTKLQKCNLHLMNNIGDCLFSTYDYENGSY